MRRTAMPFCMGDSAGGVPCANLLPGMLVSLAILQTAAFCASWESVGPGVERVPAIAVAPSQPKTILIECTNRGVMGSYDSGQTWVDLGYFVGCGNVCDIVINPLDENVVLALEGEG